MLVETHQIDFKTQSWWLPIIYKTWDLLMYSHTGFDCNPPTLDLQALTLTWISVSYFSLEDSFTPIS